MRLIRARLSRDSAGVGAQHGSNERWLMVDPALLIPWLWSLTIVLTYLRGGSVAQVREPPRPIYQVLEGPE